MMVIESPSPAQIYGNCLVNIHGEVRPECFNLNRQIFCVVPDNSGCLPLFFVLQHGPGIL